MHFEWNFLVIYILLNIIKQISIIKVKLFMKFFATQTESYENYEDPRKHNNKSKCLKIYERLFDYFTLHTSYFKKCRHEGTNNNIFQIITDFVFNQQM